MASIVRMQALTRRYGRVLALDNVTLDVPAGAVFTLAGPNGAGKSTALKLCVNLQRPNAGRVEVDGVDARGLGPSQLARIGYVSEHRELPEWMTAAAWFRYLRPFFPDWCDEELTELIRVHGLPVERTLGAMSRGQRMQAALCAALAYRPPLLVLDEPFSGLDVLVREQLMETLAARSGETTILLASHDLAEIESFATHVAYLADGRVRFVEEMAELSGRFREVEVVLDAPAASMPASLPPGWLNAEKSGCTVRFVDSHYEASATESELRSCFGGRVRDVEVRPLPLRSIFVALARAARS